THCAVVESVCGSTRGSIRHLWRVGVARSRSCEYSAAPDRSDRLMPSTDAKQLVDLAERMGIPTEDAVQRVIMRIVDGPTRPTPPHARRSHCDTRLPVMS